MQTYPVIIVFLLLSCTNSFFVFIQFPGDRLFPVLFFLIFGWFQTLHQTCLNIYLDTLGTTFVKNIPGVKLLSQKNTSNIIVINMAQIILKNQRRHLNSHRPPASDNHVSIHFTGALIIRLSICRSHNLSLFCLICISLIMNEVEHLFICLLAIYIPFWTAFSYPLPFILSDSSSFFLLLFCGFFVN